MTHFCHRAMTRLLRRCGKTYAPDAALPLSFVLSVLLTRLVWLARGIMRTRQHVFIGSGVVLEGSGNMRWGRHATIDPHVRINAIAQQAVSFGTAIRIGAYSRVLCTAHLSKVGQGFVMGDQSGCGEYCFFGAAGGITIGKHVIMGQYVSMHAQNHVYTDACRPIQHQPTTERGIRIGDDCWIGAKATILDGTVIGNGCVVAAGAVVKGVFPDNAIIGGVPAQIIKMRHDA